MQPEADPKTDGSLESGVSVPAVSAQPGAVAPDLDDSRGGDDDQHPVAEPPPQSPAAEAEAETEAALKAGLPDEGERGEEGAGPSQGQANTDEPRDDACENYVLSGCLLSEASEAASYTFAPQPADDWRTGLFWW